MNIITIMTDDLASAVVNDTFMPRVTAWMSENSTPTHMVQQNCVPSRASLLTGVNAARLNLHEVFSQWSLNTLPLDVPTTANAFQDAGFITGIFGKWHLGPTDEASPFNRGFSYGQVFEHGWQTSWGQKEDGTRWSNGTNGHDHGDEDADGIDLMRKWGPNDVARPVRSPINQSDYISGGTQALMRESLRQGKPFYIYSAFGAPHAPYCAPYRHFHKALNILRDIRGEEALTDAQLSYVDWPGGCAALTDLSARTQGVSEDDLAAILEVIYFGCILHLDDSVGDIIDAVEDLGLKDSTTIVFMNDNGTGADSGYANLHRGFKGSFFQGAHDTPCCIQHPDIAAGAASNKLVWIGDWHQTFLTMAGVDVPEGDYDGRNLAGYLLDMEEAPRFPNTNDYTSVVHVENSFRRGTLLSESYACVTGIDAANWKYVIERRTTDGGEPDVRELLFELTVDPLEQTNLANNPLYAEALERNGRTKFAKLGVSWGMGNGGFDFYNHIRLTEVGNTEGNEDTPRYWTHADDVEPVTRPLV